MVIEQLGNIRQTHNLGIPEGYEYEFGTLSNLREEGSAKTNFNHVSRSWWSFGEDRTGFKLEIIME